MAHGNVAHDNITATYGGANLNEIFYEPVFRSDDIMRNYRVMPNVKHKMNVYTAAALTNIVQPYTDCSSTSTASEFNIDSKTITAGRCRVALEQCSKEFFGTYIEEMYRSGVDVMNIEGTQLGDAIVNRAVAGIASDVVRLAWGGDGATANYDAFDGWMKLMGANATVLAAQVQQTGAATVDTVTAGDAIGLIRKAYDDAPAALQQVAMGDKKMFVSPKVFNAYLANLETNSTIGTSDLAIVNTQKGYSGVSFRGVELVPVYEWDTILAALNPAIFVDQSAAATGNTSNGVCYCAKDNLIIGSDVTDPEGSFKVFYDDLEEKMFFRGYFKLGVQFLYSSLVQWGIVTT
tara:strand:+ start:306 stop:1349 length:1044 start_codon:yes stop_codon:yes gene_type:complete